MVNNKLKCFWCNKRFVNLIEHTEKQHPDLNPRSYDYLESTLTNVYLGEEVIPSARIRPKNRFTKLFWRFIKLNVKLSMKPNPLIDSINKSSPLYSVLPKVKVPKFKHNIRDI